MHLADLPKCYMHPVFTITYNSSSRLPYLKLGISWSISPGFAMSFLGFWHIFFENEEWKMSLSFLKSQWVECQMSDHMLIWELDALIAHLFTLGRKVGAGLEPGVCISESCIGSYCITDCFLHPNLGPHTTMLQWKLCHGSWPRT